MPDVEITSVADAFAAAKAQHAAPVEDAPEPEDAPELEDEDDTGDSEPGADDPEPEAEQPAEAAKPATEEPPALITDAEFTALKTKHANDPDALLKVLNKEWTQKTQARAEERKQAERLKPYDDLIQAWEKDPKAVLQRLAAQEGFELSAKGTKPATETAAAVDDLMTSFKAKLGPEFDYLAEGLGPAIQEMVEKLTEKTVAPIKAHQSQVIDRTAQEQSAAVMKAFGETHPDWQQHEASMLAISKGLSPNGLKEADYLERLYQLATRDAWEKDRDAKIEATVTERVKARIAKMEKGAASTETRQDATPSDQVHRRPGEVSIHQAFADAKRGIRYEDD